MVRKWPVVFPTIQRQEEETEVATMPPAPVPATAAVALPETLLLRRADCGCWELPRARCSPTATGGFERDFALRFVALDVLGAGTFREVSDFKLGRALLTALAAGLACRGAPCSPSALLRRPSSLGLCGLEDAFSAVAFGVELVRAGDLGNRLCQTDGKPSGATLTCGGELIMSDPATLC
eukprot:CAMPEP_0172899596 /NCGR_PEP_ID=MMETSP1075-20121228/162185_1 /TAXON_ID=2916 /ORGANISM="Ceratium fusus, Strain PA161109" /LENGTH=179 /DNA_ID=CAMNT_0013755611 /DNA_START=97 /DNA_END=634 /DNA_ORIENTATION=-